MTKLAKYHDISAFCGKHDPKAPGKPKYAIDHVRFDASVSHLQATDGHIAINVPVDDCDAPQAVIPAKRLATAAAGGANFNLGKGGLPNLGGRPVTAPELKFPDVAKVASNTPDANLVFCLGVPVLTKLLDYAQANGSDTIHLAVSHSPGVTRKDRVVKDPIRFFMQVNVDENGETTRDVSGLLMPCLPADLDDVEDRLAAAIAATKGKAKPATKRDASVSVSNGKPVESNGKAHGGKSDNGKPEKPTKADAKYKTNGKPHGQHVNGKAAATGVNKNAPAKPNAAALSERALKAWATRREAAALKAATAGKK